jgi:hypothetical protein
VFTKLLPSNRLHVTIFYFFTHYIFVIISWSSFYLPCIVSLLSQHTNRLLLGQRMTLYVSYIHSTCPRHVSHIPRIPDCEPAQQSVAPDWDNRLGPLCGAHWSDQSAPGRRGDIFIAPCSACSHLLRVPNFTCTILADCWILFRAVQNLQGPPVQHTMCRNKPSNFVMNWTRLTSITMRCAHSVCFPSF